MAAAAAITTTQDRSSRTAHNYDSDSGVATAGHRFGGNLPRKATRTASYRTPTGCDMETDHGHPFDQDVRSFRHVFPPIRRTSSAGRTLQLTFEEAETLSELATRLRNDVLAAYETHVYTYKRHIDTSEWKQVKKRDHLVVLKQRSKFITSSSSSTKKQKGEASSSSSSSAGGMATMMAIGSIAGQLDDLLYGLSSETSVEMKMQASYASGTTLHDAAVLTTLQSASLHEPFRFLGVKWVLQSVGAGGSSTAKTVLKRRDLMYLESSGVMPCASGERVGYRIVHSVNFKSMAHLSDNAVRAKVSMCQLFRQKSDGRTIDVFMRGYYDPSGGRVSQMLATSLSADIMLQAPGDALEAANLKKLAWCAKQSGRRRRRKLTLASTNTTKDEVEEQTVSSKCCLCKRECGGMLRRSGCACMVCSQLVCTRCSVVKKLSFAMGPSLSSDVMGQQHQQPHEEEEIEIRQKALSFCLNCIVASNHERAFDVAVSDLVERGAAAGGRPPSSQGNTPASTRMAAAAAGRAATPGSRPRPSSIWQRNEDQYSQRMATPQSSTRQRAATTSGKRLTTTTLTPTEASVDPRAKALSAASAAATESSSNEDGE